MTCAVFEHQTISPTHSLSISSTPGGKLPLHSSGKGRV